MMKIFRIFCLLLIIYPAFAQERTDGIVNDKNKVIIPFVYDHILNKEGNVIRIRNDGKYGVIDMNGKEVVPCEYDDIRLFPYAIEVFRNGYRGALHLDGSVAIPCIYNNIDVSTYPENFVVAMKDSMDGVIDSSGREIVPFIYYKAERISESLVAVCKGLCGATDLSGRLVIPSDYESIETFIGDKAPAEKNGKWGIINKRNEIVVPFIYDEYEPGWEKINKPVFPFRQGERWGLIDGAGNVLAPFQYESLDYFSDVGLQGRQDGKFGLLDFSGKQLTPMKYDLIGASYSMDHGFAPVLIGSKWGMISLTGREIIPPVYKHVSAVSANCFIAMDEFERFGLLDSTGRILAPLQYKFIDEPTAENRIQVTKDGKKWGYLNEKGQVSIPLVYDHIWAFKDGHAIVQQGGKRGVIDLKGKIVIPFIYEVVSYLGDGLFKVRK